MLQPAAATAATASVLTAGVSGGKTEKAEIPAGFAALLALGTASGTDEAATPEALLDAATAALRQVGTASGKPAGKPDGKILPALPDGEATSPETLTKAEDGAETVADMLPEPMVSILALAQTIPAIPTTAPVIGKDDKPLPTQQATPTAPTPQPDKLPAAVTAALASAIPAQPLAKPSAVKLSVELPAPADTAPEAVKIAAPASASEPLAANAGTADSADQRPAHNRGAEPRAGNGKTDSSASSSTAGRAAVIAVENPAVDGAQPIAAELQPVMAMREAQPATANGGSFAIGSASSVQHGGHDFATLVDRLVEARDAAMPQAVRAAVHHADFGQISLNFQADDARLSVSMSSADPDFAPAVQAAAAMHSGHSADSGSGNGQQRQDGQQAQQHSANSASANQSQSQSQGSSRDGERGRGDTFRQAGAGQSASRQDEPRQPRPGGIYA
jgi:hypothetical protein